MVQERETKEVTRGQQVTPAADPNSETGELLMPDVIRVPFQDSKPAIDLLQQNDSRQFMRQRHLPKRQNKRRRPPRRIAKSITSAHRKQKRHSVHLLAFQQLGKFLRRILLPARIQQNQLAARPPGQCQNSRLISHRNAFNLRIARNPFQIFIAQTLNRRLFRLPDPRDFNLHASSRSSRGQHHVGAEPDLIAHSIPLHRGHNLRAN